MTKFALVGCGRIAERHLSQIGRIGKLAAVCDTDGAKAASVAAHFGAAVYTSLPLLLEKETSVEVVVVCTPNGLHAEHAIQSLQARRHVLCEKPLCIAASAAWTMRDTAHFFRRKLFVVKQARFNPPVQAVKKTLERNGLGRILSFSINGYWNRSQAYYNGSWHGTATLDGGLLYTQFSHFIDLLLWLLGPVADIKAMEQNSGLRRHFEIEDTHLSLLRMKSGALGTAHFSINALPGNKEGSLTIIGEKGTMRIGGTCLNTLEWADDLGADATNVAPAHHTGFDTHPQNNYHLVYDELTKALAGLPHSLPQAQDTVQTIELIEKMYAASRA